MPGLGINTMAEDFDVIIVGAGAAGCVLANRLSARSSLRVLLLEAVPDRPPGPCRPHDAGNPALPCSLFLLHGPFSGLLRQSTSSSLRFLKSRRARARRPNFVYRVVFVRSFVGAPRPALIVASLSHEQAVAARKKVRQQR